MLERALLEKLLARTKRNNYNFFDPKNELNCYYNIIETLDMHIYLLQTAECIGTNIYKLGMTEQEKPWLRVSREPKYRGCLLEILVEINNKNAERELLQIFKLKYTRVRELGLEYFSGSKRAMLSDINTYKAKIDSIIEQQELKEEKQRAIAVIKYEAKAAKERSLIRNISYEDAIISLFVEKIICDAFALRIRIIKIYNVPKVKQVDLINEIIDICTKLCEQNILKFSGDLEWTLIEAIEALGRADY